VAAEVTDKKLRKLELMRKHADYQSTWLAKEVIEDFLAGSVGREV
jgi:hypothetical protein